MRLSEVSASSTGLRRKGAARRWLAGCGIALLVTLILGGVGWWYVSRHLGDIVANLVKQRAAESLNGRLEFAKLDVDLMGRAVLTDAVVYQSGKAEQQVLSCPRAVVTLDLLTFLGPNRGKRAVVVNLYDARGVVVRKPDGGFNLADLVKPPQQEREPIGVSVVLHDAQLAFTDFCLLSQAYPSIPKQQGLAAQLLADLGYSKAGPQELKAHNETLTINGSVAYNPQRKQLALELTAKRPQAGGEITAQGGASSDGTSFDIKLTAEKTDLASLGDYALALFPALKLGAAAAQLPGEVQVPYLAGRIEHGSARLVKTRDKAAGGLSTDAATDSTPQVSGSVSLADLRYLSGRLPDMYFPSLELSLDDVPRRLASDFKLETMGLHLSGTPSVNLDTRELGGRLKLNETDLNKLLTQLGYATQQLDGSLSASAQLAGTLDAPQLDGELGGGMLMFGQLALGRPSGKASYDAPQLKLSEVKFSGGSLPLKAEGSFDTALRDGKFTLSVGPLKAKELPKLIASVNKQAKPPKLDAQGEISASAELSIARGVVSSTLKASSVELKLAGVTLHQITAQGNTTPSGISLDAVEGELTASQALKLAGFTSDGPLRLSFRFGGDITQAKGKQPQLALSGKAKTLNLAPEQANISYKLAGPANDPEVRGQLKTTHAEHPLALSATGHYRAGMAPVKATLTWYDATANFDGKVDLAKRTMDGLLTAKDVDLKRFAGDPRISGLLSAKAQLGGTFDKPTVAGSADLPRLAFAAPRRTYEITKATAGFKLAEGNALSVSDAKFNFEGNAFSGSGIIGKQSKQLTLKCSSFNLFSVLALLPEETKPGNKSAPNRPALEIKSAGPLTLAISGDLKNPQAKIEYASGAGAVDGHSFDSAALAATASLDGLQVQNFEVKSSAGSLRLSGQAAFSGLKRAAAAAPPAQQKGSLLSMLLPHRTAAQVGAKPPVPTAKAGFSVSSFSAQAMIENFDVAVLTPLTGVAWLTGLTGRLHGTVDITGSPKQYSADGSLKLTNGALQGRAISEASAKLSTSGKGIAITDARVVAEGTEITGSGVVGPTAADTRIDAAAKSLELALLMPFLPQGTPKLSGITSASLQLKPGGGKYPNLDLQIHDTGAGVKVGQTQFEAADADASVANDILTVRQCDLTQGASTLSGGGKLSLAALTASGGTKPLPLDVWLKTKSFNLADVAPLVPVKLRGYVPSGNLSCDLTLAGSTADPLLSGKADFDLTLPSALDLPEGQQAVAGMIRKLNGEVTLARNDLDITRLTVSTSQDSGLGTAQVRGSGKVSLNPPGLLSGSLDVVLAPEGQFTPFTYRAGISASEKPIFTGTLGGVLHVTGSRNATPLISGQVVVTAPGQSSIFRILPSEKGQGGKPSSLLLDKLKVLVQPTTTIRYDAPAYQLEAQVTGELTLSGHPGVAEGADKLTITGQLGIPDGSMYMPLFKHEIRLADPNNKLEFTGGWVPVFTGRGVLVLADALKPGEVVNTGGLPGGSGAPGLATQDLKVFFNFNKAPLVAQADSLTASQQFSLTSEPPLPQDVIMQKLLGEFTQMAGQVGDVLSGRTELAQFAEGQLLEIGSSFISHQIEREFDLKQFKFGGAGSESSPFYVDVEKQVSPDLSLTYFRNFFNNTQQQEEFGANYKLFERRYGNRYENLQLRVNFQQQSGFSSNDREFMFLWTTSF